MKKLHISQKKVALRLKLHIFWLLGLSEFHRWFEAAKFPRCCGVTPAPTSEKVTPTATVKVFTIWITGIIPLLFDNMLPESGLTSTVNWLCDQDPFVQHSVCVLSSTQRWWFCLFSVFVLPLKLRHGYVIFACDSINGQNYRSLPKDQYCCLVMEMHCHMSKAFS